MNYYLIFEVSLAEEDLDIDEHAQQADLVRERPTFSVAHSRVEIILDLKEWLKTPWVELEDDNLNKLDLKNDCFCSGVVHKLYNQFEAL